MLNTKHNNFNNSLFGNYKLIENKNNIEKNISKELLTFRTLVIVAAFQNENEELAQLEKILTACKLHPSNYKISPLTNDWVFYRNSPEIKEILLFGITEKNFNLNIQLPENKIITFDNRIWIKTASLTEIINSQTIKNDLWQNALKPHFLG